MKKNVKKILIASLVILLLGLLLCSAAFIYAAATHVNLFENDGINTIDSYDIKLDEVEKQGVLEPSSIEIRAEKSDVTICSTEEQSHIYFENPDGSKTTCAIESGILKITDSVPFYIMGITIENGKIGFAGFRNVFTQGIYSGTPKSITLYLNKNDSFENIKINLGLGNVYISDIKIDTLTVLSSFGDTTLENLNISETAEVTLKSGDIKAVGCKYVFADLATNSGDIEIQALGRKTNCETTLGNIDVSTERSLANFSLRASLSYGTISIDNEEKEGHEYTTATSGNRSIWLKTFRGNISVYKSVTNE